MNMHYFFRKPIFVSAVLLLVSVFSFAQKKGLLGTVRDSMNLQKLSQVSVRNLNTGKVVISKYDGSFLIEGGAGQLLSFSANGYFTDTIRLTAENYALGLVEMQMKPMPSTLMDVTVTGRYSAYQWDSIARRREFMAVVGENRIPPVGRPNNNKDFGVAINLDHFSKSEQNKRKARDLFEMIEEEAYINYRWTDTLVAKYTSLQGDALIDFMQNYRPSYEWLRKHPDEEDVVYYINDRLKKERRNKKNG